MDEAWLGRYFNLLEVERATPDKALLAQITASHGRIVFENVTSLIRRAATPEGPVPPLDLHQILDAWERGSAGGVCFEITAMLLAMLRLAGFDAHPIQAQITFPGSHQAIVVRLDGRDWLVDCGNGAPFGEPIPLDGPFELRHAGLSYRFRGEDGDRWQDRLIDREWQPFCRYILSPASDEEREAAYQRHHVLPAESFVVEELRIVKAAGDEVLQVALGQFTRHTTRGKQRRPLTTVEDYEQVLADEFGLPNLPIREGLRALQAITGSALSR